MTFLEAALQILGRERKPLHFKEITEMAVGKKLLTFVGRTPEVTMQTQLTAAVKKAPGNPFVRVKPGVFGLLRYPDVVEPEAPPAPAPVVAEPKAERAEQAADESSADARRGRRSRRGRRGRGDADDRAGDDVAGDIVAEKEQAAATDDSESLSPPVRVEAPQGQPSGDVVPMAASGDDAAGADAGDDDGDIAGDDDADGEMAAGGAAGEGEGEGPGRRRRRRRRRRRGGADAGGLQTEAATGAQPFVADFRGGDSMGDDDLGADVAESESEPRGSAPVHSNDAAGSSVASSDVPPSSDSQGDQGRRIMAPIDAAIEVLRGQAPGRGVHVRQIADAAVRRRLIHGEAHEAWRVVRAALAAEGKERLRAGLRPRIRAAGSGLFALARRPADLDLEKAEHVYGEAVRALRERTLASLELRLGELANGAFEALARVLLQREGFGPATFVKRVEGTVYLEALRGRGWKPSKCLVALRWGATPAGRRAIGELRAGVRARNADEGVLLLAGRLAEEAIREWKQPGPPIEVVDGPAMAEACGRHGVGVINAQVSVDFVDADFFAELAEG